jgi:hypothetical protein
VGVFFKARGDSGAVLIDKAFAALSTAASIMVTKTLLLLFQVLGGNYLRFVQYYNLIKN